MNRATIFALFFFVLGNLTAQANHVEWLVMDGAIGPVANELLNKALKTAEDSGAEALIIELDTPGGLLKTTRIMCKTILAAKIPVVMYVSPSGSRAGSAGVFLTLAAHVAVMAPGTNIGAAHPVGIGGIGQSSDSSGVMEDKVTNDAAAFARTLAERHGRNVEWAEQAVRQSKSITEGEALELGVIDFVVGSRDSLLIQLNGRSVELESGTDTLETIHADIWETEISLRLRILDFIADPNFAYILLLLGIYGLFFELYNPGAIFPGVIGVLSLILAFFSMQMLPLNWAGLLLILLAIVLFLLEIKVASYGLLSIGGIISMSLGSLMLFEPFKTGIQIGLEVVIIATIITALFFIFVVGMGLRAQSRKITTGKEGIIGEIGRVSVPLNPRGKVLVHGEVWDAEAENPLEIGTSVRIVSVMDGMLLKVEKQSRIN
jgi:membrane-bound serine protease (ClpP class)